MPTVQVNDIAMYYELQGVGEPLVLIAGLGADITLFTGMTGWFAQRYQVVAFDNRGAGRTDKPDSPYSIELMADDTAGLMAALSIERAHVLGISMGGRIALELALSQPNADADPARPPRQVRATRAGRAHARGHRRFGMEVFRGGHMFFLVSERQRFLDRVDHFLTG